MGPTASLTVTVAVTGFLTSRSAGKSFLESSSISGMSFRSEASTSMAPLLTFLELRRLRDLKMKKVPISEAIRTMAIAIPAIAPVPIP